MDFERLTWTCHICGDERPDAKIKVAKHRIIYHDGIEVDNNVRHCADRPACISRARLSTFADLEVRRAVGFMQDTEVMLRASRRRWDAFLVVMVVFALLWSAWVILG